VTESQSSFEELRRRTDTLLAGLQALSADLLAEVAQERQDVAELARTEHELGQLLQQLESLQELAAAQAQAPIEQHVPADEGNVAARVEAERRAEAERGAEELRAAQAALHAAQDEWIAERSRLVAELRRREQEMQAKESAFAAERASLTAELETLRSELTRLRSGSQAATEVREELERLQALQQQWDLERTTMRDEQAGMRATQAESEQARERLQAEVARLQAELQDREAAFAADRAPLAFGLDAARQELDQLPALKEELARLSAQRAELLQHIELVEQYWYQREATFSIERASWRRELDNANFANQEAAAELRQTKRRSRRDFVVGFSLGLVPNNSTLPIQPAGAILGMLVAAAFFTYAYRTGMAPRAARPAESPTLEAAAAMSGPATAAVAEPAPALAPRPTLRIAPVETGGRESAQGPKKRRLRRPVLTLLLLVALLIGLLPIIAILRGALPLLQGSAAYQGASWVGLLMAFIALSMGTVFFAYSIKYYLATAVVLLGFGGGLNDKAASRQERVQPNGPEGNWSGGATTTGWLPVGGEPFVSVHIATYNEKRVIERLLAACSQFDYPHYEVIVVDDSTDESTEILERWKGQPRFKVFHRPTRDGFKGGALKVALAATDPRAEYVVVFDADSIPFPDSIQRLLYHFYQEPATAPERNG
jgi:hypothetical protein